MTNRGTKLFFRRIKYCWRNWDERVAIHCSLFAVNFSMADNFFFDEKVLCVRWWDCYLDANPVYGVWRKTCSQNMANAFYRLFAVRSFFVVSPLFRCCSRIVYSGLLGLLGVKSFRSLIRVTHRCHSRFIRSLPRRINNVLIFSIDIVLQILICTIYKRY